MSELNDVFGFPQEDGKEPDYAAIFGGSEPMDAPPIPVEEPKTTDIPATEIPAAEVPTAEPHSEESAAAPAKETAKPEAPKTTKKAKSKTKEPEAEPDLFSAFNDHADTPEPPVQSTETVPVGAGQVSLFDKAPIFSYGSAKEPIEDASITLSILIRYFQSRTAVPFHSDNLNGLVIGQPADHAANGQILQPCQPILFPF